MGSGLVGGEEIEIGGVGLRQRRIGDRDAAVGLTEEGLVGEVGRAAPDARGGALRGVDHDLVVAERGHLAALDDGQGRRGVAAQQLEKRRVGLAGVVVLGMCDQPHGNTAIKRRHERRDDSVVLKLIDRDIQPIAGGGRAQELEQTFAQPA